jgi:tetratricopeptide (TPR) repeat protein
MKCHILFSMCLLLTILPGTYDPNFVFGQEVDGQSKNAPELREIFNLEKTIFDPVIEESELMGLLESLTARKQPRRMKLIADELAKKGQGFQNEIDAFADRSKNIEIREICADLIVKLNTDWRETANGKKWLSLVSQNKTKKEIFSSAWKRLEVNPLDIPATRIVLAADPQDAWQWIADIRRASSRGTAVPRMVEHNRTSYLLLRIRELGADELAVRNLPGRDVQPDILRTVFPETGIKGYAARRVGHVYLDRFEPEMQKTFHGAQNGALSMFTFKQFYHFYPKQHIVYQNSGFAELVFDQRHTFGPFSETSFDARIRDQHRRVKETTLKLSGAALIKSVSFTEARPAKLNFPVPFVPHVAVVLEDNPAVLPRGEPNRSGTFPWWWESYLSINVGEKLRFSDRGPSDVAPAESSDGTPDGLAPTGRPSKAKAAKKDAPSFVVLSPKLKRYSGKERVKAELACDRFSEELQNQSVQLVDRQRLSEIMSERQRLKSRPAMTSYDMMVRLTVTNNRRDAFAELAFVDLSTGSIVDQAKLPWPIPEESISHIRHTIKQSIKTVRQHRAAKMKVRLLLGQSPADIRMRTLADQVDQSLRNSIRTEGSLQLIEYFEANSAAEESFLLFAGLSKAPGEREFQPESDVTVEVNLLDNKTVGQTFEDSKIGLQICLQPEDALESTKVFEDTVGNLESKLIPTATRWLKKTLKSGKVDVGDAKSDSTSRRKAQAKRELKSISLMHPKDQALLREQKALAALKLDPESVEAKFELVTSRGSFFWHAGRDPRIPSVYVKAVGRIVDFHEDLFDLPGRSIEYRDAVYRAALQSDKRELKNVDVGNIDMERFYEIVQIVAERDVLGPLGYSSMYTINMLKDSTESLAKSESKKANMRKRTLAMIAQLPRLDRERKEIYQSFDDLTSHEARLTSGKLRARIKGTRRAFLIMCAALQMKEPFDELLPVVVEDIGPEHDISFTVLRREIDAIQDKKRFADFDRLAAAAKAKRDQAKKGKPKRKEKSIQEIMNSARFPGPSKSTFKPFWTWPTIDIYQGTKPKRLKPKTIEVSFPSRLGDASICPLALTKSRLYFLASHAQKLGFGTINIKHGDGLSASKLKAIGFIPVDAKGNPTGAAELLDLHADMIPLRIVALAASERHVLVGTHGAYRTKNHGLYLLDLQTNKWKYIGVANGLPVQRITGMRSLSRGRVLCSGSTRHPESRSSDTWFVFDFNTLQISDYLQSSEWLGENGTKFRSHLLCVWENKKGVHAFSSGQIWENLLSAKPQSFPPLVRESDFPDDHAIRSTFSACLFGDSMYCNGAQGLFKIGPNFEVTKNWQINIPRRYRLHGDIPGFGTPPESSYKPSPLAAKGYKARSAMPAETPMLEQSYLFPCGKLLLLVPNNDRKILGYDPKKDCWYGPIKTQRNCYALSEGKTVWLGGSTLRKVAAEDVIEAAEASDRVITGDEFTKRRRDMINSLPKLDRAKVAFSESDFATSQSLLDEVLDSEPGNFEGLLLSAFLNDTFGRKNFTEAVKAYRKAQKIAPTTTAQLKVAKRILNMHLEARNLDEAAKQAKQIIKDFPNLERIRRQELESIIDGF